jgi:hypothetical protein
MQQGHASKHACVPKLVSQMGREGRDVLQFPALYGVEQT